MNVPEPTPKHPSEAPQLLAYASPKLLEYGTVREITGNTGTSGAADVGGAPPNFKTG